MDALSVAAALTSAVLHAGWNAVVKADARPNEAMAAQMQASGLIALPALAVTGMPAAASLPFVVGAAALNLFAVTALLRAYETGGFALVYPLLRALCVLMVVPMAAAVAGELPGPFALGGVATVAAALALLTHGGALGRVTLGWTLASAVCIAACVVLDAQGVRRSGAPFAYAAATMIANGVAMYLLLGVRRAAWSVSARAMARAAPVALAAVISYSLILWVYSRAPIAPSAALRDTSAVFALIIAVVWLKERLSPRQTAAILLAAAAVPLLRLG